MSSRFDAVGLIERLAVSRVLQEAHNSLGYVLSKFILLKRRRKRRRRRRRRKRRRRRRRRGEVIRTSEVI